MRPHEYEAEFHAGQSRYADFSVILDQVRPIRSHRLDMAMHTWRRQCRVLNELRVRLGKVKQQLEVQRSHYQALGNQQNDAFAARRLPLNEINKWLEKERRLMLDIQRTQVTFDTLCADINQQQQWVDESYEKVIGLQRQIEKLDYLYTLVEEGG